MTTTSDPPILPMTPDVVPSRNPLPLSASQEQQVRDLYYKRVRTRCADEIRVYTSTSAIELHPMSNQPLTSNLTDFAACATSRTFTAPFVCRPQRLAMNTCMIARATQAEQDAAREEWFATMDLRRQEREAKEARRKEQEKFHREWWGLDEKGQRVLKTGSEDERKKDQG
ncbi:hypothetical protein LTR66_014566 [Elasticomyces elasticus]|nr:hypothetical protein LTR66_014566 [Elasticomyces elasticus]KAK4987367.1 hypothetical protein LTR50_004702 [Elasticomyces elasticus]